MQEAIFDMSTEADIAIISVEGKMFTAQIDEFNTYLEKAIDQSIKIIIDLSKLEYICSAGVGALVACYKKAQLEGGNLILSGANKHVKNIFEVIGFSKIFSMSHSWSDTIPEAKETLNELY